jgi:hypothetical protein
MDTSVIIKAWKQKLFRPVYWLEGEESYFIDALIEQAEKNILTPEEAMSLDMKIDDGKPGRGLERVWRSTMQPDSTTTDTSQDNAVYNGDFTERACSLIFIMGM